VAHAEREPDYGDEHQVTPLELFFDLVRRVVMRIDF
jgi:low temperature requirement protein LtrA